MANTAAWTDEDVRLSAIREDGFPVCGYLRGSYLGQGGYARVYKVLRTETGQVCAGKTSPDAVKHLRKEARILRGLDHPNIVKYVEYYEEEDDPKANILVMELCARGSLQEMINNHSDGLSRNSTLQVMNQVSKAVEYLHKRDRFHGDLKPRNILIRSWDPIDIVVADCAERHHGHAGKSDDIWALGITLLGMMGQWPHFVRKEERQYPRLCATHARNLDKLNPDHEIVQLLLRLLEWDFKKRITAPELVNVTGELLEERIRVLKVQMDLEVPEGTRTVEFW
ncbi:kinase-like domain-containing protein [Fusarium flagelliforme]|uniref:kinase-like domain-containing protein n=1 Tax=Fusarium flagelliforme TaxID=2675880 RepID=UPI001E8CCE82|nr:kinase-like domain-containing protein [Fusarium flagelliforme]KAH7179584.1 kinase-like domain-containing protein [Fusarium flagelliforme]